MLSDGVILLHENTSTTRKTQELLKVRSHPSYSPDLASNLGSKHLSGTRFSWNSYRELDQWAGRDFYQAGLNKLMRSDKRLNRFGYYVEK
ncbi:hypothetical protein AVEN_101220-1 [Araneus ventricosus]|uniref:Histone-lysine N-methyltransferase SETMAR n=1 Tax=Araneus ventricosus TaxID=182803 RepID=A0A4Y2FXW0_ARAVE|nr:hypothetical protein AVEN_101220-1 [Araneus ventricosus]